ncbi:MAG: class I SAM-dependent methyltransferase [bacterium]|nr:class I SAM-dependent methyltransferase [bacterium]
MRDEFFILHRGLPREGPGEPADVAWAAGVVGLAPDAAICDAGCGPGADIEALLAAAPQGHVTAIEGHAPFVDDLRLRWGDHPRVTSRVGDMSRLQGPFDLIWCAGALYFLGVTEGLTAWTGALAPGGAVAFSEPCWFTATPSDAALAFWAEYPGVTDAEGIDARVRAAGYETLATRRVSDAGWEAYYSPMQARIAELRPDADAELRAELDLNVEEIAGWRATRAESGYLLSVVRPR